MAHGSAGLAGINARSEQVTRKRVDLAFPYFGQCRIPSSLTTGNIDDVHAFQRIFKGFRAESSALHSAPQECSI